MQIGDRKIGGGAACYVIAEAGVNHDGSLAKALQLVDVAAACGADAVKFQTFRAEKLAAPTAPTATYQRKHAGANQLEMLQQLELSEEAHLALQRRCAERGIVFLSTPFDLDSAQFLVELGVPALKVSSGDATNLPFLRTLATLGLPLVLSTGMCTLDEVADAVAAVAGASIALLHCVSCYPTRPEDCNLRAMRALSDRFAVPVGWSDHTLGIAVGLASVALGAHILEKHLTLDPAAPGPDHAASLGPEEFGALVAGVRSVQSSVGNGIKAPVAAELPIVTIGRKSLHWSRSLPAGATVQASDLVALRPATGLAPGDFDRRVGTRLARAVSAGCAATEGDFVP